MSTDLDCLWSASDFLAFTRHRDDDLRAWAWGRLGLHHPDDAALHVEEGLRDESWSVVGRALHAIVPTAVPHASLDALLLRRDLPRGLRDRASRLRRGEPLPKPAQGELDAEIERLAAAPEELRRRAPELLASASYDDRTLALFALDRQPYRWAAETVLAHVPALLATDSYTLAWETLGELGDPSALQAALDAWRPGDRRLAAVVMRLHLVSGAPAARPMPEQLVRDVEDLASRFRELARRMERFELGTPDSELRLDLRCTGCGRVHEYDVERAVIHPRRSQAAPGWDGVLLGRIVVCKTCGTEDAYELTTRAKAVLVTSEGAGSPVTQEGARVVVGVANLWDGSVAKRPSEAIRHLRALAERYPGRGEGWRRLGNFCERHGRHDEAVAAWTRAAEDEAELEACIVLARELAQTTGTTAQAAFVSGRRIIERLRGGEAGQPADVRRLAAESAFDLISSVLHHVPDSVALTVCWSGGIEGKRAVVNMSSVDLRRVRRWDRLVDLLASASFTSAQLTSELPDPPVTLLARLLESDAPIDGPAGGGLPTRPAVPAREAPKVGRNDPCTCGSGKKYKKCCGR